MKIKLSLLLTLSIFISGCSTYNHSDVIDTQKFDIACVNLCTQGQRDCKSNINASNSHIQRSDSLALDLLFGLVNASASRKSRKKNLCEEFYKKEELCLSVCSKEMSSITDIKDGNMKVLDDAEITKDNEHALKLYQKSAEYRNKGVQSRLGGMHSHDLDVQHDNTLAMKILNRAAEQGQYRAQFQLWEIYNFGLGVEQDKELAQKWFTEGMKGYMKSAEQGDKNAQYLFGRVYAAALNGDKLAEKQWNMFVKILTSAELAKIEKVITQWVKK